MNLRFFLHWERIRRQSREVKKVKWEFIRAKKEEEELAGRLGAVFWVSLSRLLWGMYKWRGGILTGEGGAWGSTSLIFPPSFNKKRGFLSLFSLDQKCHDISDKYFLSLRNFTAVRTSWARHYIWMQKILAFPHFSLSSTQTFTSQFLVSLKVSTSVSLVCLCCCCHCCCLISKLSNSLCTPWTVAHQAPLPMRFPRQEYGSGLPFPSPGHLPKPGIESGFPAPAGRFLTTEPPWEALRNPVVYKMLVFLPPGPCPQFSAHTHLPSCCNSFSDLLYKF